MTQFSMIQQLKNNYAIFRLTDNSSNKHPKSLNPSGGHRSLPVKIQKFQVQESVTSGGASEDKKHITSTCGIIKQLVIKKSNCIKTKTENTDNPRALKLLCLQRVGICHKISLERVHYDI